MFEELKKTKKNICGQFEHDVLLVNTAVRTEWLKSEDNKLQPIKTDGVCLTDFQMLLSLTQICNAIVCFFWVFFHTAACMCLVRGSCLRELFPVGKVPYMRIKNGPVE